jgi:translation initiation factor 1 (eIF-1/SUI1)
MVKLDDVLVKILKKPYSTLDIFLTFEGLFSEIFDKLSPMHSIVHKYSDNKEREPPILRKGKFKPIEFKLESRGGNKKLTVIYHLNEFSIDPKEIQKEIRTKLGCSANFEFLNNSAASNISEEFTITVQGNQVNQVVRLLKSN